MSEDYKKLVNQTKGPYSFEFSKERVEKFQKVVGWGNENSVPSTLLTMCRKAEFEFLDDAGIPVRKILHGEQEYTILEPIQVGDTLEASTTLEKILEKKGKTAHMIFGLFKSVFKRGETIVAESRTTMIMKEPAVS